ncbi:hypothetical protein [Burkholderia ubonensis]|uniref:hypothetical protein n=1 Tax=Burkholderia ubonensis TaxID=101571 RepID=UPI00075218EA|nr:hypothetical protein [Burkholderia ubonensis]KVV07446.1 hypothetical protein WK77_16810 [Burkholderia ubonensis]
MSMSDRKTLTDEQIAGALAELGEDVSVARVAQLKSDLEHVALPDVTDSEAVKAVVDAARHARGAGPLESRKVLGGQIREAARNILASYAGVERVSNLYDNDMEFSSALRDLVGEDFEYPDFSHMSVAEAIKKADSIGRISNEIKTSPWDATSIRDALHAAAAVDGATIIRENVAGRFIYVQQTSGRVFAVHFDPLWSMTDLQQEYESARDRGPDLQAWARPGARVVSLPDGYNGHTMQFYVDPIEVDGETVKLRCAEPGKEYMIAWRSAAEVRTAVDAQSDSQNSVTSEVFGAMKLRTFEITAAGFDANDDKTDDRVFWIQAASAESVQSGIQGTGALFIGAIEDESAVDFRLPEDLKRMRDRLVAFSQVAPEVAPASVNWKEVAESLYGAVDSLETQVDQMKGLFPDDDGLIQEALDEASEATRAYVDASQSERAALENFPERSGALPSIARLNGGVLVVHTKDSDITFVIPSDVTDQKRFLIDRARLDRLEAARLFEQARQLSDRAKCAAIAAEMWEQPAEKPDHKPSEPSLDM